MNSASTSAPTMRGPLLGWGMARLARAMSPRGGDDQAEKAARVVLSFSAALVGLLLSQILLHLLLFPEPLLIGSWIVVAMAVLLCPLVFRKTGNLQLSFGLMVGIGTLGLSWLILWTGGIHSPSIFWLHAPPVVGVLTVGRRSSIFFMIATGLAVAIFAAVEFLGVTPASVLGEAGYALHVRQTLVGLLALYYLLAQSFILRVRGEMRVLAEQAEQNQQLIRVVCHDLGTPLLVAQAHSESLAEARPNEATPKALLSIVGEMRELLEWVRRGSAKRDEPTEAEHRGLFKRVAEGTRLGLAGERELENARLVALLLLLSLVNTVNFVVLDRLVSGSWALRGTFVYFYLSMAATLLVQWRSKDPLVTSMVFIGTGIVGIDALSLWTGGIDSPDLYWVCAAPLVYALLVGGRGVLWVNIAVAGVSIAAFWVLDAAGGTPANRLPDGVYRVHWIQTVVGMSFLVLFSAVAFRRRIARSGLALEAIRSESQALVYRVCVELSGKLEDLSTAQRALEVEGGPASSLGALKRASSSMRAIVDGVGALNKQLLDGSRLEIVEVDVADSIEELHGAFAARLAENDQTLDVQSSLSPGRKIFFVGAKTLTYQVLGNLLGNAIKFSPDGATIELILEEREETVEITIRDGGTGIESRLLPGLFRVDLGGSTRGLRGEKGTGYGLPIAKSYVDRSGGSLAMETRHVSEHPENSGTSFTLRLRTVP